jgi:hypothetical protein
MGGPSDEAAEALYNTGRYPGVVTFTLEMSYNFYALGHKHPAPQAEQLTSGFHHVGLPSMTTSIIVVISTHPQNETAPHLRAVPMRLSTLLKAWLADGDEPQYTQGCASGRHGGQQLTTCMCVSKTDWL